MDTERVGYAEELIGRADEAFRKAERQLKGYISSYSKVYSEAQEAVELYTKAIVLLLTGDYPTKHGFTNTIFYSVQSSKLD